MKGIENVTYKEARVYLDEMSKYGSVLGLDTIRGLLRELGDPQDDLKFIHIAGTNGKGSVLAYTSTVLSKAGYRIGRYVSPTVIGYLEKMQIDGTWISETEFAELAEEIREAIARLEALGEPLPTLFEVETAMAFLYFKKNHCDLVVLETGLGGELDATNIIKNTICAVFATISRDHLGVIGDTLEEIAQTKSGIIKPGCAVVSARQEEAVSRILRDRAEKEGCSYTEADLDNLRVVAEDYKSMTVDYKIFRNLKSSLTGAHQRANIATALEVIMTLQNMGYQISEDAVRSGISETIWTGRFTCLQESPVFIIDGAHNEDAAYRLRESVKKYFQDKELILIMGVFKDKEYEKITSILCPYARSVYTIDLPNRERTLSAEGLAESAAKYCDRVKAEPEIKAAVEDAMKEAKELPENRAILACGSLSYLGVVNSLVKDMREHREE